jgi:hypothetical protein
MEHRYGESTPSWETPMAQLGQRALALLSSFVDLKAGFSNDGDVDHVGEAAIDHAMLLRTLALTDVGRGEWLTTPQEHRDAVSHAGEYLLRHPPWGDVDRDFLADLREVQYPPDPEENMTPGLAELLGQRSGLIDGYSDWLGLSEDDGENLVIRRIELQGSFVNAITLALNQYVPEL